MNTLFSTPFYCDFLSLFVILTSSYGAGSLVGSRHCILKFAFGMALFSFAAWCFSSLSGVVFFAAITLLIIASIWGIYRIIRDFKGEKLFFITAAAIFFLILGSLLLFPYSWDECVYQTALLKHYAENQSNAVIADNPFSFFPALPHSLMRLAMETTGAGIRFPRMLAGAVMALSLASVVQTARRCGGSSALLIAAAAILSPVVLITSRANYAEQFILLFCLSAVLTIFDFRKTPLKCAVLTAVFTAAALSVKLTGAGIIPACGILFLLLVKKEKILSSIAAGAGVFLLFCLPFFLRPYLATGNPFYPFVDWHFTNDPVRIAVSEYHHLLGSYRYGTGFISGICYGWLFTAFDGKIFDGITVGWQFPLMIIFNIAMTVYLFKSGSTRKRTALLLLFCGAALYIFWAASSQQSRFMIPLLMLTTVLSAFVSKALPLKKRQIIAVVVLLAALADFPAPHLKHFVTAWKIAPEISKNPLFFLAAATRDKGYFEMVEFLETTPADSKVLLLLNERRTLYLPRKAVIGEPFFQKLNTPVPESADKLFDNIKKFDCIVVSTSNQNPDAQQSTQQELLKMAGFIAQLRAEGKLQMVFSDSKGEYFIFRCGETATGTAL